MTRYPLIRKAITADRSHGACVFIVLAAVAVATLARAALTPFNAQLTFATYYPAVLVCSLLTGWRYALASGVVSGLLAEILFHSPNGSIAVDAPTLVGLGLFLTSCAFIIATGDTLRRTVRELEGASRLAQTLNIELQHRVKNILTVVQALASLSAKGASPDAFRAALDGRLNALATAHDLLGRKSLATCALPDLVDQACKPFCEGDNIRKSGPACELPSESCVPLVLALHELCTNAVKYGALSTPLGRVEISWSLETKLRRVVIDWTETGGPAVTKPMRKGLGSSLLRAQPGLAQATLSFEPSGVRCKISIDGAAATEEDAEEEHGPSEKFSVADA